MSTAPPPKNPTILEKIYAQRAKDVELAKSTPGTTPVDIAALLASNVAPPLIPFVDRLKRNPSSSTPSPSPSLMAEIKRASPSKGPIALSTNPAQQALTYALSGASVISVLTEPTWFHGSLLDLRLARAAIDALPDRPAILRKEFILDEYQIAEARLHGADTILLIVAMLPPDRLRALYAYALSLDMEPLVEVNNAEEMKHALALGAKVIGVNNRNLHDFNVDMGTTSRLVEMVRERDVILCALSGISSSRDIQVYKDQGVRAVLIGEALMRADDTSAFIRELLQWPEPAPSDVQLKPWILVSGVTDAQNAIDYLNQGADMLGIVFDPSSKVSNETASDISKHVANHCITNTTNAPPQNPPTAPWFTAKESHLRSSPTRPLLVGIFRDQPLESILYTTSAVKLDLVLLDDTAPFAWAKHIPVPVIRRFHEKNTRDVALPGLHSFVLVERDTSSPNDFAQAAGIVNRGEAGPKWPLPIILSGGLTGANVQEAIRTVSPWAVEVSLEEGKDTKQVLAALQAL